MKWEVKNNTPKHGDIRFRTRFAWCPTRVLSKLTMTDHMIWLQLYVEEQEYIKVYPIDSRPYFYWETVAKTIHI